MVIYTPARWLGITTSRTSINTVNVSCVVDHTFPRPLVMLYTGQQRDKVRLQGLMENVNR